MFSYHFVKCIILFIKCTCITDFDFTVGLWLSLISFPDRPPSTRAILYSFFSSPEHEVLMVSYCDQSLSVVRRPSSVRCQLFASNDFSSKTARRILK